MSISFPTSPSLLDEYVFSGRTWQYNGRGWELKQEELNNTDIVNALGYTPYSVNGGTIQGNAIINGTLDVNGTINAANILVNGESIDISPAFNQANTATTIGSSAFNQANLAFTQANNVGGAVTTANGNITASFNQANLAFTQANNVGGAVTTANGNITAAFGRANSAQTIAVSAFSTANAALANTSGVSFDGDLSFPTGNIGIGRTATSNRLDVNGTINAANLLVNGAPLTSGADIVTDIEDATRYVTFANNTTGTFIQANVSTSLIFNPSTGTLSATIFNSTSDENLKSNVITLDNALNKTNSMRGVSFTWKDNGKQSIGVIAQEVEKVLPEVVTTYDGVKSVNYDGIIGLLIESIKELKTRIEHLESKK
jgi:hypothetical protein